MIILKLGTTELKVLKNALSECETLAILDEVKVCDVYKKRGQTIFKNDDPRSEYTQVFIGAKSKDFKNYFYEFFKLGILYNLKHEKL